MALTERELLEQAKDGDLEASADFVRTEPLALLLAQPAPADARWN